MSKTTVADSPPVLAADLGGTKMLLALVSADGRVIARERQATLAAEGPAAVIRRLLAAIDRLLDTSGTEASRLHSISVAAAGAIDSAKGVITLSPNLPGWHDIALAEMVRERLSLQTFLVNDASAAALGEHRYGAGRGVSNLVLLTVGTGIGGGIIINSELYLGASGAAGEIGHMSIDLDGVKDSCGNTGCLETLASGTAVAREAARRLRRGGKSALIEMVSGRLEDITAEKVGAAARSGDVLASEVISAAAGYLGVGLVNLVNIFNPEMIIIGGGMALLGDLLLEPARRVVRERAFKVASGAVRIVTAQLGDDAGVCGAAAFARSQPSRAD